MKFSFTCRALNKGEHGVCNNCNYDSRPNKVTSANELWVAHLRAIKWTGAKDGEVEKDDRITKNSSVHSELPRNKRVF